MKLKIFSVFLFTFTISTVYVYGNDFIKDGITYKVLLESQDDSPGEVEVTGPSPWGNFLFQESYIPDEVTYEDKTYRVVSFNNQQYGKVENLRLGKYIREVYLDINFITSYFEVSEENENLKSVKGIIFSKDGKKLVICPNRYALYFDTFRIPDEVEEICKRAFYEFFKVGDNFIITFPSSLKVIGDMAFTFDNIGTDLAMKYFGTDEIVLPPNLQSIGKYAFYGLRLKTVEFNEGLCEIGCDAFSNNNLTDVVLPSTLKRLGENAFNNYWGQQQHIRTITCLAPEPPEIIHSDDGYPLHSNITSEEANQILVVPVGKVDAYRNAPGWSLFGKIVELGTDYIKDVDSDNRIGISIAYNQGQIIVKGARAGDIINVYNAVGLLLESHIAESDDDTFRFNETEKIIIVKAGNKTVKLKI